MIRLRYGELSAMAEFENLNEITIINVKFLLKVFAIFRALSDGLPGKFGSLSEGLGPRNWSQLCALASVLICGSPSRIHQE